MSKSVTEMYLRVTDLAEQVRRYPKFVVTIMRNDEGLFVIDSDHSSYDGQGDTIEAAFASFLSHVEDGARRDAADAEDRARRIRAALSGEKP